MTYTLDDGRTIRINDQEIEHNMKALDITRNESIVMWLEDNGYQENEIQNELTKKAKENRITATIHQARGDIKSEKKPRPKKVDDDKKFLISMLDDVLRGNEFIQESTITNDQKIIEFKYNGKWYKLDLVCSRNKNKSGA